MSGIPMSDPPLCTCDEGARGPCDLHDGWGGLEEVRGPDYRAALDPSPDPHPHEDEAACGPECATQGDAMSGTLNVAAILREAEAAREDIANDEVTAHTPSADPLLEGECAWVGIGLVHESYSDRDISEIASAIVHGAAVALVLSGWTPPEPTP